MHYSSDPTSTPFKFKFRQLGIIWNVTGISICGFWSLSGLGTGRLNGEHRAVVPRITKESDEGWTRIHNRDGESDISITQIKSFGYNTDKIMVVQYDEGAVRNVLRRI